ncbi:MAG: hypothetical protein HKN85_08095, partial [Gammaproteobacteria bacterium]|nr:hypothetical protein [Gammaproteobacteria bacterium]
MSKIAKLCWLFAWTFFAAGCTTINVDHIQLEDSLSVRQGDAVVILGSHHSAEIETESSLVACIGGKLQRKVKEVTVIPELQFVDDFYPWFEARTAPQHPKKLRQVLDQPGVAQRIEQLGIRFFVWVEGSTERTNSAGSMTCSIGPTGGGCFGFGTWEDTSDYETTIWDIESFKEVGRISTEAVGTSYMPAFVIPIPMLAQVEGDSCEGMGNQ